MSDVNLNEKLSLANSNEDNNKSPSSERSFNANIENDSSSNIANNYIYLLNNDINRIINSEEEEEEEEGWNHLNQYLPVYKPNKLLNNDSSLTTTTASSSTLSIIGNNHYSASNSNDYDYIYNKYKNSTNLMQTFKSIQLQTNDDKQQK